MTTETAEPITRARHSNSYNIFILVLTVLSLAIMVLMFLPSTSPETWKLLNVYDNIICIIFLVDFFTNLRAASKKSDYFIKARGWRLAGLHPFIWNFQIYRLATPGPPEPPGAHLSLAAWRKQKDTGEGCRRSP